MRIQVFFIKECKLPKEKLMLDVLVNTHFAVAQSILLQLVANLVKTLFVKIIQKKKNQTLTKEKDISLHVRL